MTNFKEHARNNTDFLMTTHSHRLTWQRLMRAPSKLKGTDRENKTEATRYVTYRSFSLRLKCPFDDCCTIQFWPLHPQLDWFWFTVALGRSLGDLCVLVPCTESERDTQRETDTERERERGREGWREGERETHTDRQTDRQRQRMNERERENEWMNE